jgi:hypothetical protein
MSFNLDTTLNDMASAISGVISDEWSGVKECVKKALEDEKDALAGIVEARLGGEIDDEDMKSHLEDEKVALEAALLACQVKAKIMAQNAVNAAIEVLMNAVKAAL